MKKFFCILIILMAANAAEAQFSAGNEGFKAFEQYKAQAKEYLQDLSDSASLIRKWRQRRLSEIFEQRLSGLEKNLTLSNENLISEYNKFKKEKGADILDDSLLLRLAHLYFEGSNLLFNKKMKDYNAQATDYAAGRIKVAPTMPVPDYNNAIYYAKKILTDFPDSPLSDRAHYLIGYSYDEMGMTGKAIKIFERLIAKYPYSVFSDEVSWRLAEHYFNLMDYQSAKFYYSKLSQSAGIFKVKSIYKLGASYFASQDYERAYQAFKILIQFVDSTEDSTAEDITLFDEAIGYMGVLKTHGIKIDLDEEFQEKIYLSLGETYKRKSDETSMRAVYEEAIRKFPYASYIPLFYTEIIASYEDEMQIDRANRVRDDFINLMTKSEYWWDKNDASRLAVFRAEDFLEEHLLKNARYFAMAGYRNKSASQLATARVRYERFLSNYEFSPYSESAMMELADLEYYSSNFEKAAELYLKLVTHTKSNATRESAAYSYLWAMVKKVNYNLSVSESFQINDSGQTPNYSNQESVFLKSASVYTDYVKTGMRRQKILLKTAQVQAARGDLGKAEKTLNELISSRDFTTMTTVKAIWFLSSIYNLKGEWSKVTEVSELLPTLRLQVDSSVLDEHNSLFQRDESLAAVENLISELNYADAIKSYKDYIANNPRSSFKHQILFRIAILYRRTKNIEESEAYLNQLKGTKLEKDSLFIHAMNQKSLGQFEKAAQTFEKFIATAGNHAWKEQALISAVNLRKNLLQWKSVFNLLSVQLKNNKNHMLALDLIEAAKYLGNDKYIGEYLKAFDKKDIQSWVLYKTLYIETLMNKRMWASVDRECKITTQVAEQVKRQTAYVKLSQSWCQYFEIDRKIEGAFSVADLVPHIKVLRQIGIAEVTSRALSDVVIKAFEQNISDKNLPAIAEEAWSNIKDTPYHPAAVNAEKAYFLAQRKLPIHIGHLINWRLGLMNVMELQAPTQKDVPWESIKSACESGRFDNCLSGLSNVLKMTNERNVLLDLAIAQLRWGNDVKASSYFADFAKAGKWDSEAQSLAYVFGLTSLSPAPLAAAIPIAEPRYLSYVANAEKFYKAHQFKEAVDSLQAAIQNDPAQSLPYAVMARILFENKYYQWAAALLEEGVVNTGNSDGLFALRAHIDASLRRYGRIGYTLDFLDEGYLSAVGLSLTALKNKDKKMQQRVTDALSGKPFWLQTYLASENVINGTKNKVENYQNNAHLSWLVSLQTAQDKQQFYSSLKNIKSLGYSNPLLNQMYQTVTREVAGDRSND